MNALTKIENTALSTMDEAELMEVLQSSLYPGANPQSIKMVLGYCKAAGLDPMQKPVHIVPMWDNKAKQMRDVVMPGIGLYRTQAARTGEHVGTDEPEYGPMVEFRVGDFTIQHPEWCKVTVYRLKAGMRCAYTATEFWVENYATAGKDTTVPNAMWKKRTRGQIAKCAEAQALRKGFPEVGNQPTAEEMEGKFIDGDTGEVLPPEGRKPAVQMPQARNGGAARPQPPVQDVTDATPKGDAPADQGQPQERASQPAADTAACSAGEIAYITKKLERHGVSIADARAAVGLEPGDSLDGLTKDGFIALKDQYK